MATATHRTKSTGRRRPGATRGQNTTIAAIPAKRRAGRRTAKGSKVAKPAKRVLAQRTLTRSRTGAGARRRSGGPAR